MKGLLYYGDVHKTKYSWDPIMLPSFQLRLVVFIEGRSD